MRKLIAAAAAGGIFAAGCGEVPNIAEIDNVTVEDEIPDASSDNWKSDPIEPLLKADVKMMAQGFDSLKASWLGRSVLLDTTLTVLRNDQSMFCELDSGGQMPIFGRNDFDTQYCGSSGTVVMTEGTIDYVRDRISVLEPWNPQVGVIIEAHELGHAVQEYYGISPEASSSESIIEYELQADCLGGDAVAAVLPEYIFAGEQLYTTMEDDSSHGTSEERLNHFRTGTQIGGCLGLNE
jgi:hypothetical protein